MKRISIRDGEYDFSVNHPSGLRHLVKIIPASNKTISLVKNLRPLDNGEGFGFDYGNSCEKHPQEISLVIFNEGGNNATTTCLACFKELIPQMEELREIMKKISED